MATALRPRPRASTISSRYGSQALALGARAGSVDTAAGIIAGFADGSGGHLPRNGRCCRGFARPATPPHRDPCCLQVPADRLTADPRRGLDARQRPAQSAQRTNSLLLLIVQDIAHAA